ncbi:MAG: peptidoglycan-binding protein [Acidimicrobiales bacterium]
MGDLQQRLTRLDLPTAPDPDGAYELGTRAAVEAFQHRRGLRVDGVCGPQTWSALVEAGYRIGDRFLYHRSPMLRGDDVADLQRRLSSLGFDTGRVDGIFGLLTSTALAEFQRNLSLPVDAILGGATLAELKRVAPRGTTPELVSVVRARETIRSAPRTLLDRRVAIAEEGGLDVLVSAIRRRLSTAGAKVVTILSPDGSVHAERANSAGVEVFLGLRVEPDATRCKTAYYSGFQDESPGGRLLAEIVHALVAEALDVPSEGAHGMTISALRETRMPAVVCEIGPAVVVARRNALLADALVAALTEWVRTPVD